MDDDIGKLIAQGVVTILLVTLAVYFAIFLVLPVVAISGGYAYYAYRRDHPTAVAKRLRERAIQLRDHLRGKFPAPEVFAREFPEHEQIAVELYAEEALNVPALPPEMASAIDLGRYVDELSRIASTVSEQSLAKAKSAIRDSLSNFASFLPDFLDGPFDTIPADAILNVGRAVEDTISPYFATGSPFIRLQTQLTKNLHRASGIPHNPQNYDNPKLILPSKSDLPPRRLIKSYLKNTPLEQLFFENIPIGIPEHLRFEGTWIIAPPGRGKTTLLSALLIPDLIKVSEGGASVVILDSKGDLSEHLRQYEGFDASHKLHDRLVLIEPSENLALNPLDLGASYAHTIDLVEYILTQFLDAGTTAKQGGVLRRCIIGVQAIPGASFATFLDFLNDWSGFAEHIANLPYDDRVFFESGKFDEPETKKTRNELYWRIDALMTKVPVLRGMFKAPKTLIDIGAKMDAGNVIIIDNSERAIGAGQEFFGRLFLALILGAAHQRGGRPDSEKLPCFVYVDEAHTVISRDPATADILDRCRSHKIGLILAHQRLSQIKLPDVADALANCAIRFANSDEDAKPLASRFRTTEEAMRGIARGHFMLFMRDYTTRPLEVSVPDVPVSNWPKMLPAELRAIRDRMRQRYCYTALPPPPVPTGRTVPKAASKKPVRPTAPEAEIIDPDNVDITPRRRGKDDIVEAMRIELEAVKSADGYVDVEVYMQYKKRFRSQQEFDANFHKYLRQIPKPGKR